MTKWCVAGFVGAMKCNDIIGLFLLLSPSLALDPTFGIHSHKTLDTAQP